MGRWFLNGPAVSDLSGASEELGGAKVLVDGLPAKLLSASETELSFLCPEATAGSELEITVQTDHGIAAPIQTVARASAPGLFSVDGSGAGQGSAVLEDGVSLAMVRNYRVAAQPAAPGSQVTLYATGLDKLAEYRVRVVETEVSPDSITPVPGRPGVFGVSITLPKEISKIGNLNILLIGNNVYTNTVTIAVEGNAW
jgi:uncharacterized protein (TIGR03437 family)